MMGITYHQGQHTVKDLIILFSTDQQEEPNKSMKNVLYVSISNEQEK